MCFLQVLRETKQRESRLPKKVVLQIDNSWKENKNRTLLGLLTYLVQADVLNEVRQIYSLFPSPFFSGNQVCRLHAHATFTQMCVDRFLLLHRLSVSTRKLGIRTTDLTHVLAMRTGSSRRLFSRRRRSCGSFYAPVISSTKSNSRGRKDMMPRVRLKPRRSRTRVCQRLSCKLRLSTLQPGSTSSFPRMPSRITHRSAGFG
jgi:hypothetical protein